MSVFGSLLNWLIGIETARVPTSTPETSDIIIKEGGKTYSAAEFYQNVSENNEKEAQQAVEEFLIRVNDLNGGAGS
jgi:hypothetical protein